MMAPSVPRLTEEEQETSGKRFVRLYGMQGTVAHGHRQTPYLHGCKISALVRYSHRWEIGGYVRGVLANEHGGDVWGDGQRPPSIPLEVITLSQRNDVRRVAFGQRMLQLRRSMAAKACGIGLEHVTRARGAGKFGIAGHGFGPVGPDPFQCPHAMPHVFMLQETVFLHEFFDELAPGTVSMFPLITGHVEHGFDKSLRITGGQVDAKVVGILPRYLPTRGRSGL